MNGRVLVIGAGRIGLRVAARLAAAGFPVAVRDTDPERVRLAREAGIREAGAGRGRADEVCTGEAGIVITALPGPAELERVIAEEVGRVAKGTTWLDLTSADPATGARVSLTLEGRGVDLVAAPLSGGPGAVDDGTVGFHVGGRDAPVERVLPILLALGGDRAIVHRSMRQEDAYLAKLLVNALWFTQAAATVEVVLHAAAVGLDIGAFTALLARGPARSAFIDGALPAFLDGDDIDDFELERVVEELDAVERSGADVRVDAPVTAASARLHREALALLGPGPGELRALRLLERRSGRPSAPG